MNKMFSVWKGRFAFLPLGATLQRLLFSSRCETKLGRVQIFVLRWGGCEALCHKHGSPLAGRQPLVHRGFTHREFLFHGGLQALIYLQGEEGVALFRGSTEYIETGSLVISDLLKAFMCTVLEGFDITSCQMTKVLACSSSVCSVFPAPRLYKLCCLLLAAISLPSEGVAVGEDVPGVAAVAPGISTDHQPWHHPPGFQPSISDPLRIKKISGRIYKGRVVRNT